MLLLRQCQWKTADLLVERVERVKQETDTVN